MTYGEAKKASVVDLKKGHHELRTYPELEETKGMYAWEAVSFAGTAGGTAQGQYRKDAWLNHNYRTTALDCRRSGHMSWRYQPGRLVDAV